MRVALEVAGVVAGGGLVVLGDRLRLVVAAVGAARARDRCNQPTVVSLGADQILTCDLSVCWNIDHCAGATLAPLSASLETELPGWHCTASTLAGQRWSVPAPVTWRLWAPCDAVRCWKPRKPPRLSPLAAPPSAGGPARAQT